MLNNLTGLKPKRTVFVVAACAAFFGGVWLARFWLLGDARGLWLVAPIMTVCFYRRSKLALVLVVLCFAMIGWWRGTGMMQSLQPYQNMAGRKVVLVGKAADDGVYGKQYQTAFSVGSARLLAPVKVGLPGTVAVSGFGASAVYRGDTVRAEGKLYLTRGNNYAGISFAKLTVLERGNSPIDSLRRRFGAGLQSALPEPAASFALGLLIGQRNTLPEDTTEILKMVGLTHIIAVSGYNLTIIVNAVRRLLGNRSKFQSVSFCIILICLFLLLTGNSPPIARASIISMLSLGAWYYGRSIKPLVLLMTAGAVSVWFTPSYIWGNVSWYLSFLAFFGVVMLAPLVVGRIYGARRKPGLVAQIAIESICAEVCTLPYVLFIFGQMSLVGLPANVLVAAFVPLAMLLGLISGLAGMWLPVLAGWLAWPARLVLTYMLDMANLLSRVPYSFVENIGFSAGCMATAYIILALVMLGLWKRKSRGYISSTTQEGS